MKKLITVLAFLCLFSFKSHAQFAGENRNDYSPYGLDFTMLDVQMRLLAPHEDATQITYFDLNFVDQRMQDFMRKEMNMGVAHFPFYGKENGYQTLTITYLGQATMGTTEIQSLVFKYTLFDNKEKHTIIKSLTISGSSNKVINFFVSYWPTTMNINVYKNKIAYNYLLQDKATIRCNGKWSILVENTTINSSDEYYRELNNGIASNKLKKNLTANKPHKIFESKEDSIVEDRIFSNQHNYNSENITNLIFAISNTIKPKQNVFFNGNLILNIGTDGIITSVKPYNLTTTVPKDIIDTLSKFFVGKLIPPFTIGDKGYKSYKNCSFTHFGSGKVTISDDGTLDGNPNVVWK